MTILVTGGAGYIGSHMVLALTDRGEEVVVLDNLSTGFDWAVSPKATLVQGDIGDEALLDRIMAEHRFDAVVHFAGSIVVPDSVRDPLGYYLNNTVKSRMLMACAVILGEVRSASPCIDKPAFLRASRNRCPNMVCSRENVG